MRVLALALALAAAPAAGQEAATPPDTVAGGDGFRERVGLVDWDSMVGARATVHFRPDQARRGARVLVLAEAQAPLPGLPPAVPRYPSIYLASDEAAFDAATGGRIPEWGAGVAIPDLDRIVLPLYASGRGRGVDVPGVLRHEWAHLGLHDHLNGMRIPRWFDEGYAQWASGGWDAMEGWRLRVAFATGRAPPLDSLALGWPRGRASAELAYGLSATVVEYLVQESGVRGLEVLLARWPEMGFDAALRRTYGVTAGQLERDWQKYVKQRYGWLLVLSHSLLFWAGLSVMLLGLFLIRRRRDREAMARLRAGEGPDTPAFWLETGSTGSGARLETVWRVVTPPPPDPEGSNEPRPGYERSTESDDPDEPASDPDPADGR